MLVQNLAKIKKKMNSFRKPKQKPLEYMASLEPRYVVGPTVPKPAADIAIVATTNVEKKIHLLHMANADHYYNNQARIIDALEKLAKNIEKEPMERMTNEYFKNSLETLETYWVDVQCNDEILMTELSRSHPYFIKDEYCKAENLYVAAKDRLNEQYQVLIVRRKEDSQLIGKNREAETSKSSQDQHCDKAEGLDHKEGLTHSGGRRVVKALSAYTAGTFLDIGFKKGDRMEVLDDSSPDWWGVFHLRTMTQGLVPANLVVEETPVECEDWFFPHVSRKEAEELLLAKCSSNPTGTFLVRPVESSKLHRFTLSIKDWEERRGYHVKHYRIKSSDRGGFYITASETFPSLSALIETYSSVGFGLARPCPKLPLSCEICDTIGDIPSTVERGKTSTPDEGYDSLQPRPKPSSAGLVDVTKKIRSLLEEMVKSKESMGSGMAELVTELDSRVGDLLTKLAESDSNIANCIREYSKREDSPALAQDLATSEPAPVSELESTQDLITLAPIPDLVTSELASALDLAASVLAPEPILVSELEPDPDLTDICGKSGGFVFDSRRYQILNLITNVCFWVAVFLYAPYCVYFEFTK